MKHHKTLSNGTEIHLEDTEAGTIVYLDSANAPEDMRPVEAGRIITSGPHTGFQPAMFAAFAMGPELLRALADILEEAPRG